MFRGWRLLDWTLFVITEYAEFQADEEQAVDADSVNRLYRRHSGACRNPEQMRNAEIAGQP